MNLSGMKVSELKALQDKISEEIKKRQEEEIAEARKEIQAIAQRVGLPVKDLITTSARATKGSTVPVRYRHPDNPELKWTGRGHQPKWVREWVASGKSIDDLRI